jgi:hypothetical protein
VSAAVIRAKHLGLLDYSGHASADNLGDIVFVSGAKFQATNSAAVTADAFAVLGGALTHVGALAVDNTVAAIIDDQTLTISGALTVSGVTGLNAGAVINATSITDYTVNSLPADVTINVSGNAILTGAANILTIAGTLNVTGAVTQGAVAGVAITVSGEFSAGSFAGLTNVTSNQGFIGSGEISIGTLNLAGTGGAALFAISATDVSVTDINLTGASSGNATLNVTGAVEVSGVVTFTNDTNDGILTGTASNGVVVFKAGSSHAVVDGGTLDLDTSLPTVETDYAVEYTAWETSGYSFTVDTTYTFTSSKWVITS